MHIPGLNNKCNLVESIKTSKEQLIHCSLNFIFRLEGAHKCLNHTIYPPQKGFGLKTKAETNREIRSNLQVDEPVVHYSKLNLHFSMFTSHGGSFVKSFATLEQPSST